MTFLFQTKMAENDPTFYLGNYLKSISGLPEDLKKNFTKKLPLVVTQETGGDHQAAGVGPGDRLELIPPPAHGQSDPQH